MTSAPQEDALAWCRNCDHIIVWQHDRDDAAEIIPGIGFWYRADTMTEVCGGSEEEDEDGGWHIPRQSAPEQDCRLSPALPLGNTWKPGERVELVRPQRRGTRPGIVERIDREYGYRESLVIRFDDGEVRAINPDAIRHRRREEQDEIPSRPTTNCGCGHPLIWVGGCWQHDAAPYLWGDDHDPDAEDPHEGDPTRTYWDQEDGVSD